MFIYFPNIFRKLLQNLLRYFNLHKLSIDVWIINEIKFQLPFKNWKIRKGEYFFPFAHDENNGTLESYFLEASDCKWLEIQVTRVFATNAQKA